MKDKNKLVVREIIRLVGEGKISSWHERSGLFKREYTAYYKGNQIALKHNDRDGHHIVIHDKNWKCVFYIGLSEQKASRLENVIKVLLADTMSLTEEQKEKALRKIFPRAFKE